MNPEQPAGTQSVEELGRLIKAVADYGEQARLLALNLAVAGAKLRRSGSDKRKLDDDIFSMVTRMSSVARQVAEVAHAAEQGFNPRQFKDTDRLLRLLLEKGVFNADVISHLERSLHEALALAEQIAEQLGVQPVPVPSDETS